jgi:arylsulfatase A-like enzyme/predicted Zn-dependent protease
MRRRAIVIGALVLVVGVGAAAPRLRPWWRERALRSIPRPLSVLLVTLDTTRADRLGAYGHPAAATPRFDALAERGVLFRQAYAHVPLTCPSHASLLTGRLPPRHGVRDNGGFVLAADIPTLAERFADAGHRTAAFVSAFVLDRRFGLARGFGTYHDRVPAAAAEDHGDPSRRSVRAEETVGRALEWLRTDPARPFFLWVHLFDPHQPYEPPEPFASRFREDPYQGEIAYMDAQLGRLLEAEAARRALVAVVGDHGEGLGDHEEVTHSYFIYSNTQRVPLLLALPGHLPEGTTVEGIARGVDLAPTLLDLAGLPALPDADGVSLTPQITGARSGDVGPAYLESYHPRFWWGAQELLGLRSGRWLFIEAPRPELYDVAADPSEKTNLAAARPTELEALRNRLRGFNAGGAPPEGRSPMDAETERNLRALGYLGAGAAPPEGPLPDAKDNGPLLDLVTRGHGFASQGRPADALVAFQKALALNPRAASVRLRVADALLQLDRVEEAFQAYAEAARERPDDAPFLGMSRARARQGRRAEAVEIVRAGLKSFPASTMLNTQLGQLRLEQDDAREAERAFRAALAAAPFDEGARWGLAQAMAAQSRMDEAVPLWLALAEDTPDSPEARQAGTRLLAWADRALDQDRHEEAGRAYEAALKAGAVSEAVYLNLGLAQWKMGKREDAMAALARGLVRFPDSAELHYRTARLLEAAGRRAEAAAAYRRTLELAPGRADAVAGLKRLGAPG